MARRTHRRRRRASLRRQRHAERLARRSAGLLLMGTVLMMIAAAVCLVVIGPPPVLGVDALWVHGRQDLVRAMLLAVAGAMIFSGPLLLSRRARPLTIVVWLIFFAVCLVLFSDRLLVIHRVLWNYAI